MSSFLSLLQLSDPALPIGGFSHSAGLETYVQLGIVNDKNTAKEFIIQQLSRNIFFTDAAFVSFSYDAAEKKDLLELIKRNEECSAVKLAREMREASQKMGGRLSKLFSSFCNNVIADQFLNAVKENNSAPHYSVAFGLFAYACQISKNDMLHAFYYNIAAGMVTNSVKLVPLGQKAGQEILFSLHSLIEDLVKKSITPDQAMIGVCCTGFDIRSMQHEQLYSRLYMS
jgi:urease accessory protein